MQILITGANGMLGRRLVEVFRRDFEVEPTDLQELDVTVARDVREYCSEIRPDWILHAAAYTRVDLAESDALTAYRVNALGTRNVSAAAAESGASLLYFSTDYVFDGRKGSPYVEWDRPNPLNTYGASKWAGEWFVRSLTPSHLIVRTSWLFGPDGANFVDKIASRARSGAPLKVVTDQTGCPTYTRDLAEACLNLVRRDARGTYHVTNSGHCSWFQLAQEVLRQIQVEALLEETTSQAYETPAKRPDYSVLSNYMLRLEDCEPLRTWQQAVSAHLETRHE